MILISLHSTILVLLVRSSDAASIKESLNTTYIFNVTSRSSIMNITEDDYLKGIMILESNQTTIGNYSNEGVIVTIMDDHDPNLNISDFIMFDRPQNITCTRRDYNGDVVAIFKEKAGPIDTAYIVFNATYDSLNMGRILNTTELVGLKILNETIVDCSEYSMVSTRRLSTRAKYSLAG